VPPKQKQPDLSHWGAVDTFTVDQASCLWVGIDPSTHHLSRSDIEESQIKPIFQLLSAAIHDGQLPADSSTNPLAAIGEYLRSSVKRNDLKAFANSKQVQPVFLFDTLMPKGGRPLKYDWDALGIEIIRIADLDGLPNSQAELIEQLLQWCENNWEEQPADSSVKSRVSDIYNKLGRGQKLPK
jgi:hypothetical protein